LASDTELSLAAGQSYLAYRSARRGP